jgi:hypothetical protein
MLLAGDQLLWHYKGAHQEKKIISKSFLKIAVPDKNIDERITFVFLASDL